MAKKIEVNWGKDWHNRSCYILTSSKDKINTKDIYEAMETEGLAYNPMVAMYFMGDQIPEDVYEKGDEVYLYDLDDLTGGSNQGRLIPIPRPKNGECSICNEPFNSKWNYCPCCGQEYKEK